MTPIRRRYILPLGSFCRRAVRVSAPDPSLQLAIRFVSPQGCPRFCAWSVVTAYHWVRFATGLSAFLRLLRRYILPLGSFCHDWVVRVSCASPPLHLAIGFVLPQGCRRFCAWSVVTACHWVRFATGLSGVSALVRRYILPLGSFHHVAIAISAPAASLHLAIGFAAHRRSESIKTIASRNG